MVQPANACREVQCDGKVPFRTKPAAKHARADAERHAGRMDIYRCPWCNFWHLGHKPYRVTRG